MDTTGSILVGRVRSKEYLASNMKKWVTKIWGKLLDSLPSVVTMTKGWFSLHFHRPEHVSWVLSKYWHIEMMQVLLKRWTPLFDSKIEQLGAGPIWVRMPGLQLQFWIEDVFRCVANDLGVFLFYDKYFLESSKMAYACILFHLDTRDGLVKILRLQWWGNIKLQKLDYKGVPSRCRSCHEFGHTYKEYPLLAKEKSGGDSVVREDGQGITSNMLNQTS